MITSFSCCLSSSFLNAGRIRLGHFVFPPYRGAFQRLDGTGLIEVDHRVKLLGKHSMEVVADPLGLWTINHTDRPFEQWLGQRRHGAVIVAQCQQELWDVDVMEEPFVAPF